MRNSVAASLSAAVLIFVIPACHSDRASSGPTPVTPTEVVGLIEEPGAAEAADDSVALSDSTSTSFRAVWGPYTDASCSVTATASSPDTKLTVNSAGCDYFVYVTGHFSGISPVSVAAPAGAAALPIWPIVYADRIKIGASGTSFMLHVNSEEQVYTVIRLRERDASGAWAGGEIEIMTDAGSSVRIPKNMGTSQAVRYNGVTRTLSGPADLTTTESEVLTEVMRRAGLKGAYVPADAP